MADSTLQSRYPERSVEDAQDPWWLAKVKPRQEKRFALDLFSAGIEYYLPLYDHTIINENIRRTRTYQLPLFPGYVPFSQRSPSGIYSYGRVVDIIKIVDQKRFVFELSRIYRASEQHYSIEPISSDLKAGEGVVICAGPLKGMSGRVVRVKNSCKVIVTVHGLGCASVEVPLGEIERAAGEEEAGKN